MGYDDYYYYSSLSPVQDNIFEGMKWEVAKSLHPIFDPKQARDYLNQTKIWIDANRVEHRIKDMDESYLFNVLAWVRRRSDEISFAVNFDTAYFDGSYATVSWIFPTESPLYKKIYKQYKKVAGL